MARGDIPKIAWGTGYANTLYFGYPLDNAISWSDPRAGFEVAETAAGTEDAWDPGVWYLLTGDVRWIPTSDDTTPMGDSITGWDGATGWRAFLEWARPKQSFRFYPDKDVASYIDSYLVQPNSGAPSLEKADATRKFTLAIRNASNDYSGY